MVTHIEKGDYATFCGLGEDAVRHHRADPSEATCDVCLAAHAACADCQEFGQWEDHDDHNPTEWEHMLGFPDRDPMGLICRQVMREFARMFWAIDTYVGPKGRASMCELMGIEPDLLDRVLEGYYDMSMSEINQVLMSAGMTLHITVKPFERRRPQ